MNARLTSLVAHSLSAWRRASGEESPMDPPLRKRVQLVVRDEDEDEEEADTDFSIDRYPNHFLPSCPEALSSGLEQFARMCKSNMRKVLDASSEVQRPSWYMGPITVGLPTEGVDLLQRPEAPKPVVASNRNVRVRASKLYAWIREVRLVC